MLKECVVGLATPLSHIFNLPVSKGVYLLQWKQAVEQLIYKQKGDRSPDPKYYRPIAPLSCVSNVLEGFVREQLLSRCFCVDCLPDIDEQFGFLPDRSIV